MVFHSEEASNELAYQQLLFKINQESLGVLSLRYLWIMDYILYKL